jgi:hypothetical protein
MPCVKTIVPFGNGERCVSGSSVSSTAPWSSPIGVISVTVTVNEQEAVAPSSFVAVRVAA